MATASARPSIFLRRPILSSVISIIITLCGAISMQVLPIAQYPDLIPPTVAVTASYPGASAETIASTVLAPLEVQVNGVEHMLYMTSTSSSGAPVTCLCIFLWDPMPTWTWSTCVTASTLRRHSYQRPSDPLASR